MEYSEEFDRVWDNLQSGGDGSYHQPFLTFRDVIRLAQDYHYNAHFRALWLHSLQVHREHSTASRALYDIGWRGQTVLIRHSRSNVEWRINFVQLTNQEMAQGALEAQDFPDDRDVQPLTLACVCDNYCAPQA